MRVRLIPMSVLLLTGCVAALGHQHYLSSVKIGITTSTDLFRTMGVADYQHDVNDRVRVLEFQLPDDRLVRYTLVDNVVQKIEFDEDRQAKIDRARRINTAGEVAAALLQGIAEATPAQTYVQAPAPAYVAPPTPVLITSGVVTARIDGEFTGWSGETVFVLTNGQVWQQAEYKYFYHYAYSPEVHIVPSNGAYVLVVSGTSQVLRVRRLK